MRTAGHFQFPILGDIPIIGPCSEQTFKTMTELIVIISLLSKAFPLGEVRPEGDDDHTPGRGQGADTVDIDLSEGG
jgi:hypothetical protein